MSASLDPKAGAGQAFDGALDGVSSSFSARAWVAMGEVVGDSAAAALLQYMARAAAMHVALASPRPSPRPTDVATALRAAAERVPFSFAMVTEAPARIELTWEHPVLHELPASLRHAFTRGVFQGVLAATPAGAGWGVMVLEESRPVVVLTRGIP